MRFIKIILYDKSICCKGSECLQIFNFEKLFNKKSIFRISVLLAFLMIIMEQFFFKLIEKYSLETFKVFEGSAIADIFSVNQRFFVDPLGIYAYLNSFAIIFFSILAMNLGVNAFFRENQNNTIDFLLTKPFSRDQIFFSKVLNAVYHIVISSIIYFLGSLVSILIATGTDFSFTTFILIFITFPIINILFISIGVFFGVLINRAYGSILLSTNTVLLFFLFGIVYVTTKNSYVRYFAPFQYFIGNHILDNGSLEGKFLLITFAIIMFFVISAYIIFKNKQFKTG